MKIFRRWIAKHMLAYWARRGCMVVLRGGAEQTQEELLALLEFTQRSGFLRDGREHHYAGRHAERKIKSRAIRAATALATSAILDASQVPPVGTTGAVMHAI